MSAASGLEYLKPFLPGLESALEDSEVSEIMINGPGNVWVERANCVRFEVRGLQEGAVTIRDLVRHALRHRPDHIVVGEVRGGEAADLLQALNTGHGGSLTTVHANNAESALSQIASCAMQGGGELPWEVTCRGVVDGISMVIHMTRREGRRFVEEALFVKGYEAKENQNGTFSRFGRCRGLRPNIHQRLEHPLTHDPTGDPAAIVHPIFPLRRACSEAV